MITQEQKEKALKFVEAIKNATQSFQACRNLDPFGYYL